MRYGIKTKVDANLVMHKCDSIAVMDYIFDFETDSNNRLISLTISRFIESYEKHIPYLKIEKNNIIVCPNTPFGIKTELIEMLRHIESIGSFWFGINKIDTNEYKVIWIPENDIENEKLNDITSYEYSSKHKNLDYEYDVKIFSEIVKSKDELHYLTIPMAFFREGRNDYYKKRYIFSFYNFYFLLEDVYGKGKWRQKDLELLLLSDERYCNSLKKVIKELNGSEMINSKNDILTFLDNDDLNFDEEGITKLIIKTRGRLHHYSSKSTQVKGNPFNERDFESIALLLMRLCVQTYIELTCKK